MSSGFRVRSLGFGVKFRIPQSAFRNQKGMALLMTILVVALLSMLILDIHSRSYMAITRAKNSVNGLKAYYIMRSGVSAAQGFLEIDAKIGNNVDTLTEDWAQGVKGFPVGDGVVSVDIVDESSKLNINNMLHTTGIEYQDPTNNNVNTWKERYGRLLRILGLDEELASKTVTWLKDNKKDVSYRFQDISELLLVPGFTPEAFNKVKPFLTVHTSPGINNININTASKEVLSSLSPKLTESLVAAIMDYRKEHPILTGDLNKVQGMDQVIIETFSNALNNGQSANFTVSAEAKVSDTVKRGTAVITRTEPKLTTIKVVAWKEE